MNQKTNSLPAYIKLNPKIRPQDDFYAYVCHQWSRDNPCPATHGRWGIFNVLNEKVEKRLNRILNDWLKKDISQLDHEQRQVVIYYQSLINNKQHSQRSLSSLQETLATINQTAALDKQKSGLLNTAVELGFYTFFDLDVDLDSKNNSRYCLILDPGGLELPDREYYLSQKNKLKAFRKAYLEFIANYNRIFKQFACQLDWQASKIMEIETTLAQLQWPRHKAYDNKKTYNLYSWQDFEREFKFAWPAYMRAQGLQPPKDLLVSQPSYLRGVLFYLKKLSEDEIRMYLNYKIALRLGSLIDDRLLKTHFDFFGKTLSGARKLKSRQRRAARAVEGYFSDTFGQAYVKRYFPASSKKAIEKLAQEVADSFAKRLANNSWMSATSRRYAQDKLAKIIVNVGYGDTWENYDVELESDNLITNRLILMDAYRKRKLALLEKAPDRRCFDSLDNNVQVVNAWTNPILLNTNYPAAFLQSPFYNPQASFEYNLGALGSVIGHELTHNFDIKGSRYDIDGHLKPWLKKEEQKAFEKAAAKLIKHANKHQPVPKIHMKGKQVIGELIADLGGLEIVVDIVRQQYSDPQARKIALKQLFIAHAFYYAINESMQSKIMLTQAGVHPDHPFRVNGIFAHCDAFYEAFDLKKGDNLYLKKNERVSIW